MSAHRHERSLAQRRFVCPVCGVRQDMPKSKRRKTNPGHIKTAWCYNCRAIQNLVQVDEAGDWRIEQDAETQDDL